MHFALLGRLMEEYLACLCICMSVHLSICLYIHPYVCLYVHVSGGTFVQPYVPQYIPHKSPGTSRVHLYIGQASRCQSLQQCCVQLIYIPSVFWVMMIVKCFCLLGLEVKWIVLRLLAVEAICDSCVLWCIILHYDCYNDLTMMGLPATLGQHDLVLLQPLMQRDTRSVVGLTNVPQQQPQSQIPPQAYANYAMVPPQMSFLFRVSLPLICLYKYVSLIVYAFCFWVPFWMPFWMPYSPMVAKALWICTTATLEHSHGRHMCILVMVIDPCQEFHWVAAPSTALRRGSLMLLSQLSSNHSKNMVKHTALGLSRESCNPSTFSTLWHSQLWICDGH